MSTDLVTIIGNLSRSLYPVQHLVSGFAYLLGIIFIISALMRLKKMGESRRSGEKPIVALSLFFGGGALLFLPSMLRALTNTVFGVGGNVLQYADYNPYDIRSSMKLLIQTAGILWFVRGSVLLATNSGDRRGKQGPKGLAFVCAGVLAMNFENTGAAINAVLAEITSFTMSFKGS